MRRVMLWGAPFFSFSLIPGSVSEQVTVAGQAPLLGTASSTYGGEVSQQEMTNLPLNGLGIVEALVTVPGVSMLGIEPSINGSGTGRLFEAASGILIDRTETGQVDSDLLTGGYGSRARMDRGSVEGVAETHIVQSSFNAEYGQDAGGGTNFITESGTNAFPGNFGTPGRNTARGPWVFRNDFSLFKSFKMRKNQSLEFRAEMFNIFNTPQFAAPIANIHPRFGQSIQTIASAGGSSAQTGKYRLL